MVNPFYRVIVDYMVAGTARISWLLDEHFIARAPFIYQLQGSYAAGATTADDWFNIGQPKQNTFFLLDGERKLYGKTRLLAYRVELTDIDGNVYYSEPAEVLGKFTDHDFAIASEILRKETLRHSIFGSVPGFLLKARRYGEACSCIDPLTDEVTDSECELCYGTGIITGYFDPIRKAFVEIQPSNSREHRDMQVAGTEMKNITKGRFIGSFPIVQGDVWIADGSDERYYIHTVTETATWKSVPLVVEAELRVAPATDKIYDIVVPDVSDEYQG